MKIAITLVILLITSTIHGQHKSRKDNQEAENSNWTDDNARTFFKKDYKKQNHQPFTGTIHRLDNGAFQYNSDIIIVHDTTLANQSLFERGILHSGLFGGGQQIAEHPDINSMSANQKAFYSFTRTDTLYIGNITELPFLSKSAKVKRFKFWLGRIGLSNPTEYYFELTNPQATSATNQVDFIKDARLTFFKQHSIII